MLVACSKPEAPSFPWSKTDSANVPAYEIVSKSSIPSLDNAYAVSVATEASSPEAIRIIAEQIIESLHPSSNIQIFFYKSKAEVNQPYTLAKAAWAPKDYEPRNPGDYTNFSLEIEMK